MFRYRGTGELDTIPKTNYLIKVPLNGGSAGRDVESP